MKKTLIYGYGNPGRQDDGLGIMLTEHLEQWVNENQIQHIAFDANYQLNIEDASLIKDFDLVIFVDASIEDIEGIDLTSVIPSQKTEFTMHAMAPEFVLHLCHTLYGKFPATYLLHLKGYQFDFLAEPTAGARRNLKKGIDLLKAMLGGSFDLTEQFISNHSIQTIK